MLKRKKAGNSIERISDTELEKYLRSPIQIVDPSRFATLIPAVVNDTIVSENVRNKYDRRELNE